MTRSKFLYLFFFFGLNVIFVPFITAQEFFGIDPKYKNIVVKEVISTDTVILEDDERIQLIGLKGIGPKRRKDIERDIYGFVVEEPQSPLTPIEEKSLKFVKELLEGQHVRIELDTNRKGEGSKTLAYIFCIKDNLFVNAEILRQGFAKLSIQPPNLKYEQQLREAYIEARTEKRGLQGE